MNHGPSDISASEFTTEDTTDHILSTVSIKRFLCKSDLQMGFRVVIVEHVLWDILQKIKTMRISRRSCASKLEKSSTWCRVMEAVLCAHD